MRKVKLKEKKHMTDLRKAAEMALEFIVLSSSKDRAWFTEKEFEVVAALRQALAQPEQEPVAWADKVGAVIPHSHKLFQPDLLKDYTRPLYTAPPKREWVGYTNEDRERIVPVLVQSLLNHDEKTMAMLLKAILIDIELQLKEKNT